MKRDVPRTVRWPTRLALRRRRTGACTPHPRLQLDFEANLQSHAVMLDLIDEIERLRAQLQRGGIAACLTKAAKDDRRSEAMVVARLAALAVPVGMTASTSLAMTRQPVPLSIRGGNKELPWAATVQSRRMAYGNAQTTFSGKAQAIGHGPKTIVICYARGFYV